VSNDSRGVMIRVGARCSLLGSRCLQAAIEMQKVTAPIGHDVDGEIRKRASLGMVDEGSLQRFVPKGDGLSCLIVRSHLAPIFRDAKSWRRIVGGASSCRTPRMD